MSQRASYGRWRCRCPHDQPLTGSSGARYQDFLKFKRALGYSYRRAEYTLRSFEHFACAQARRQRRSRITLEFAIKSWLCRGNDRSSFTVALDLGIVRQLCLYRRRRDPDGFVPEHAWAPNNKSVHVPYVFSHEEIGRLLRAAGRPGVTT